MTNNSEFDLYAEGYDEALAQGISVSGEDKSYFSRGRIAWLTKCLSSLEERPKSLMDFGCGTASATPYYFDLLGVESILGIDTSSKSLDIGRNAYASDRAQFLLLDHYQPSEQFDLVFCNGVFHHIPPEQRAASISYIYQSLRPGGLFAFWENNPLNPGTRYIMSKCPFDKDAITLLPSEARFILCESGFEILGTDFLFIFPRMLSWFRWIEPLIARLPFGAQYQVLGRKPGAKFRSSVR